MKTTLNAMALAVALALGAPALAAGEKQQQSQGAQEQMKGIVSAGGTVTDRARVRMKNGETHEIVKLRTPDGTMVVADLGVAGSRPTLQEGEMAFVAGRAARINGKPVVFARYAGELREVGDIGRSGQSQQGRVERLTFDLLDDNKDRAVSRAEAKDLPELSRSFQRLDENGDGRLSHAEFGPGIAEILWSGGPGYAQAGER